MIDAFRGKRVAVYAGASTKRRADNDLSVPDQIARADTWIAEHGATKVKTWIDAGASATDDGGTEFQAMMAFAMEPPDEHGQPVDIILVHSLSRLFRSARDFMQFKAQLERHKVRIVSITQSFGDGPASELAEAMLALFDASYPAENSKHVKWTRRRRSSAGSVPR